MKSDASLRIFAVLAGTLLSLAVSVLPVSALPVSAWNFVSGELRVDTSEIYNARDYIVTIAATDKPSTNFPDYTAGWLGLNLANNPGLYGSQFIQVGLLTDSTGVYWFVYAEPGVQCLQGQTAWGNLGCKGNSFVALNTFQKVELVTYLQGFWIARVYDTAGTPHDVAKIWSTSTRIYRAYLSMEEATLTQPDPYLKASFLFWHPQFTPAGTGFVDWRPSVSMTSLDEIRAVDGNNQNTFCPQRYGANPNQFGDQRYWYAGTGGQQCSWLLFPNATSYGPDVRGAQVVAQNKSFATTRVNQAFMRADGSLNCGSSMYLSSRAQWIMNACGGSATVAIEGFGDARSIILNDNGITADAYEGIPNIPSASGLGIGTSVYVPATYYNYYSWYTTIYVQSVGTSLNLVSVQLYDNNGNPVGSPQTANINAKGQAAFSLSGVSNGSAVVTSSQPVAVAIRHQHNGGDSMEYPGLVGGGTVGYTPWLAKNYYGWNSAYVSQEITGFGGTNSVAVTYYPGPILGPLLNLNSRGRSEVYVGSETRVGDGWQGSAALIRSSGSGQIVTAAHHSSSAGAIGYVGFKAGGRDLYLPLLKKNVSGWDASLVVQNVAGANAVVTVQFYYPGGGLAGSVTPFTLTSGTSRELYTELPSGFSGSVWVHSDGADIVTVVHENAGRSYGYGAVP